MNIVKVELVPFRQTRSGGRNYAPGETIEVVGESEIGMLGSPDAKKYLVSKMHSTGDQKGPQVYLSKDGDWHKVDEAEADKAVTAFRKAETARLKREAATGDTAEAPADDNMPVPHAPVQGGSKGKA